MLLLAHPLQAHRPARHRARGEGGIGRDVVGAVVAVAAGALGVDAADVALLQTERDATRIDDIEAVKVQLLPTGAQLVGAVMTRR